ncbi:hypothetical protein AB9F46_35730, partial [Rhizobium leguminosarum]|uniref:hypothetical protein n=1 Tax=Rhizobium leguminosarum TaxID=384 RepID=UPI003F94F0CB
RHATHYCPSLALRTFAALPLTPLFRKPALDEMGRDIAETTKKTLFRKNDLDEMTVGRTEKPVTGALPEKPDAAKSTKRFSP